MAPQMDSTGLATESPKRVERAVEFPPFSSSFMELPNPTRTIQVFTKDFMANISHRMTRSVSNRPFNDPCHSHLDRPFISHEANQCILYFDTSSSADDMGDDEEDLLFASFLSRARSLAESYAASVVN